MRLHHFPRAALPGPVRWSGQPLPPGPWPRMAYNSAMREFSRIKRLPPYVFNITNELKMAARRRGEDVIDLSMGNPDGPTPKHIVDKLVEAAQRQDTHGYSVSKGIPRLRKAICERYRRRYGVEFDPDAEAIVTIGSKEGLAHLMLACLERGDTVLVPNPSYPIHIYGAIIAGADIRSVRMTPGVDFFAEAERAIRELIPKPKMLVLGFPSNPTAKCVELEFFERVVALAREHEIMVVHDLAYADIVFDGYQAPSIMQVPGAREVAVEFFTMSKSYNMAGWRIGFMVGNRDLVHALARIKSYHDYGTFTPIQVASIVALEGPQDCVEEIRRTYEKRRDVMVRGLHDLGWRVELPRASMYVWAKVPEPYAALGSLEFTKRLLEQARVAVSPGIGFGDHGDDHVRIALIENEHRLRQALRGIRDLWRKDGLLRGAA
jgi:alanine-synthesizing transaminase